MRDGMEGIGGRGGLRIVIGLLAAALSAAAALGQPLNGRIDPLVLEARLGSSRVGVMAVDAQTGETLIEHKAGESFIPASNMKLLTSGAALALLGEGFVFRTELLRTDGALVVTGDGDPALGDPELLAGMGLDVEQFLALWTEAALSVAQGGLKEIVLDTRVFDDERVHPTWPVEQLNRWYCAEVSGLNFHTNVLSVFPSPGPSGAAPALVLEPRANWLQIRNMARSVNKGSNTVWVARALDSNAMTLYGELRWTAEEPILVALHDPALVFGRLLADRLAASGAGPLSVRAALPSESFAGAQPLTAVETPLTVALRRCNVDSHNLYADALLKRIAYEVTGQPGSWTGGAAVVRMVVTDLLGASDASTLRIADGSGMSRENRVSPRTLARWLAALRANPALRDAFMASLPLAGRDGTLKKRFKDTALDTEVLAKSGYLNGVSTLSGFLNDPASGRSVAFSILVNDIPANVSVTRVKAFHEAVVAELDGWLAGKRGASVEAISP